MRSRRHAPSVDDTRRTVEAIAIMGFLVRRTPDPAAPETVLLTGAARGIGRATAFALGARGYRLGLIDREEGPLAALVGELREKGISFEIRVADVRDGQRLKEAVGALESSLGPTDVVVACAGVGTLSSALD